ncbi:MAG TPA: hypothetical protein VIH46_12455 [Candidatus Acidoferrales bacterium]
MRQVKGKSDRVGRRFGAVILALSCSLAVPAWAEDLKQKTVDRFQHYVELSEAQMDAPSRRQGPYLWVERLGQDRRATADAQLRAGEVVIERLETPDPGGLLNPMTVPDGMIHHWIGTVFIPGSTLAQTLTLEQDYDHHQDYFRPDVMRSKILRHDGKDFTIALRLCKKRVITTVLDTEHEVHYEMVDSTRAWSRSQTTRIQEVENAGEKDERLQPPGHDRGFLWRMNTYWRFEQKDGGTYVECQSISLTRDIPAGLGWLIGPYVTSVPRQSLTFTLATTRSAVLGRIKAPAAP